MAGGVPRQRPPGIESRLRQAWERVSSYVEAALDHLRANWTDGLLALGFIAVALLSTYVLLLRG